MIIWECECFWVARNLESETDQFRRFTAPDSLLILIRTHNLRELRWHKGFVPRGCSADAVPAISAAAGHRMFDIYKAAAAHNSIIVGGEDPNVGIGGYLTDGGHSLISAHYSLTAYSVFKLQIVISSENTEPLN